MADKKPNEKLCEAIENNDITAVKDAIQLGADIGKDFLFGMTALHIAVQEKNNLEIIKYLVEECGADVNAKGGLEDSPVLLFAIEHNNIEIVKYLVEHGADVNAKGGLDDLERTALHKAAGNGNLEIVKYLVEHGADASKGLCAAAWELNLEIVKYLVEHGADVNIKDGDGETPLHCAIHIDNDFKESNNDFEIVKYLVEHGADVNAKGEEGNTPLDDAKSWERADIVKYLQEHGAK